MASTEPSLESVQTMDLALSRLARASGALRFGLGAGLEVLARTGGHHELGFASVEAYALERCERSSRWVQASRWLARRLEELHEVRGALLAGKVSFSMAQCIAKVACAADQGRWLADAEGLTVREMRVLAGRRAEGLSPMAESGAAPGSQRRAAALSYPRSPRTCAIEPLRGNKEADSEHTDSEHTDSEHTDSERAEIADSASSDEESVTLQVTVDREDAWLFECARLLVGQVAGMSGSESIEALLGEGTTSLLAMLDRAVVAQFDDGPDSAAQREWEAELSRWREEAEARCEASLRARAVSRLAGRPNGNCDFDVDFDFQGDVASLDARLRGIAADLVKRDVALGELAESFWKADGWRRLGYATATQYTRERLGMSLSAIKAKRALARRVEQLPRLSAAVANGELGYEAARLVACVATPDTVEEWLERAAERTVRYLREEVDAVQLFARLAPGDMTRPPCEEIMRELAVIESRVVSGAMFQKADVSQMSAGPNELPQSFERARRRSSAARHAGRVALHVRVTAETRAYYRWLERLFERHGPPRVSFLRFLCCALIDAWKHTLGSTAEYASVYGRDRYRCQSPVCGRRGVTPHHLKFRSAGGDDSDENIASLCVWCHLEGIHGGRLRAAPPASDITWSIGRSGQIVVRGRRRVAA